jgi:hypothetical protein
VNDILHILPPETKLQYIGLNEEDAESLTPLFLWLGIVFAGIG